MSCRAFAGSRPAKTRVARGVTSAVAGLVAGALLATSGYTDAAKTIDIALHDGHVVGQNSARVVRGDTVILRWSSDRRVELHLHGYDVEAVVVPDAPPAQMKIQAHATGRFPVEIHGADTGQGHGHGHSAIFYLEVYPD